MQGLESEAILVSVGFAFKVKMALELFSTHNIIQRCLMRTAELQGGATR